MIYGLVTSLVFLFLFLSIYTEVKVSQIGQKIAGIADKHMVITKAMTLIVEQQLEQEILYEKSIKLALEAFIAKSTLTLYQKNKKQYS